jgi:pimeloyl-ACP methyl ester carboxylesterase
MLDPVLIGAAAAAAGALSYGSAYAAWANARFPAHGRMVKVKGARLHVIERGEGPPVALLHGASANAREFEGCVLPLLDGFRALAFDRPGHGHSSRPAQAAQLKVAAGLIAEALSALDATPAVIVAHSLGSATALRLALDHPEKVAGLVLIAPASHPYPGLNAWHARWAAKPVIGPLFARLGPPMVGPLIAPGAVAHTFAPAPAPPGYADQSGLALLFRPKTFRANAQDLIASKAEFAAQYFRYDEIACPAAILTAETDRVVSPRIHAVQLKRAMVQSELITVPGAGHMPHQIRPQAVAAAVARVWRLAQGAPDA